MFVDKIKEYTIFILNFLNIFYLRIFYNFEKV